MILPQPRSIKISVSNPILGPRIVCDSCQFRKNCLCRLFLLFRLGPRPLCPPEGSAPLHHTPISEGTEIDHLGSVKLMSAIVMFANGRGRSL